MKTLLIKRSMLGAIELKITHEDTFINLMLNEFETGQSIRWHLNPRNVTYSKLLEIADKVTEVVYVNEKDSLCSIGIVLEEIINSTYIGYVLERDFPDFDNFQNPEIMEYLVDEELD